ASGRPSFQRRGYRVRWHLRFVPVTIRPMIQTRPFCLALLVASLCLFSGCVERKITIGSAPAGAIVTLNDEEVGRTPVTVPFTWYGDYDIVLRLEKNVGTADKAKNSA